MSDRRNVVYLYDGSFDGLLCCVFEGFANHELPSAIEKTEYGQQSISTDYFHVSTDSEKSERVAKKIVSVSGQTALRHICLCYLSDFPDKELHIFNYIRACLKFGFSVNKHLTTDCVNAVITAAKSVSSEAHLYVEFIRFSELDNGVYYSKIEPKYNVLPIIASHFSQRYHNMPFIIHDVIHCQCIVYNGKNCEIRGTDGMPVLNFSSTENKYRKLWKQFYDTISIQERHNEKCRMTHMPKRFWRCMTEFQTF